MLELNICSSGEDTGEYAGGFLRSDLRTAGALIMAGADVVVCGASCAVFDPRLVLVFCSAGGRMNGLIVPSGVSLECEMERSCVDGTDEMALWFDNVCACP